MAARLKKIRTENETTPKGKISPRRERGYIHVLMGIPLDEFCNKFAPHGLTPERRRMLWEQYRETIMENWSNPNTRPLAWWWFDCPVEPPFPVTALPPESVQFKFLRDNGLL